VSVVEDLMIVPKKLRPQKPRHLPGFFFAVKKSMISNVMQIKVVSVCRSRLENAVPRI
jgi:hypothetical protein